MSSTAVGDNWSGWRGDGSGISREKNLPTHWTPAKNILWKTPIEGNGISSPIVWGDQVFVTTGIEGTQAIVSRVLVLALGATLLLLALASVALNRRSRAGEPAPLAAAGGWPSLAYRLDRIATVLAVIGLLGVLFLTYTMKGLNEPGLLGRTWRVSGFGGMLGLMAAVGFLPATSVWRLLGAGLMLAAAVLYHYAAPRGGASQALPLKELLVTSGPLCLAAGWSLLLFAISVRVPRSGRSVGGIWSKVGSSALLAAVVLQFAYVNYLQPRSGMLRSVVCLDRDTGEIRWRRDGFIAPADRKYRTNSYATPTPLTNGKYLVAAYGPGIACMDMQGNVKWTKMEPKYAEYLRYGGASSPALQGNRVIYAFMTENPTANEPTDFPFARHSYLAALDIETGDELWRACPPEAHDCYGSPVVIANDGRPAVLFSTYHHGLAYDAKTGEELWVVNLPLEQPVPSFVASSDTAFLTGGIHGPQVAAAIKLGGKGDVTDTHVKWKITKGVNEVSSPVFHEGLLYWVTEVGILHCIDAGDRSLVWKKRVKGYYDTSPVVGDGKIYFMNSEGETTVVKLGREYQVLATNSIGEETHASPAISSGRIFIRGKDHLYCVGTEEASSQGE